MVPAFLKGRRVPAILKGWRGLAILTAAVLLTGTGLFLLDRMLEAVLLQEVNAYLSSRTLAVVRSKDFKAIQIDVPIINLSLLRRRIVLKNIQVRFDGRDGLQVQHFEATVERAVLTGVDISDLIWHRHFRLDGVAITGPRLRHLDEGPPETTDTTPKEAADTLPVTLPAADSLLFQLVADWLPDEVRQARIEEVRVDRAVISSRKKRGNEVTADSSFGLSLVIQGLELDTTRQRVFERGKLLVAWFVHATPGRGDSLLVRDAHLEISSHDTTFGVSEMRTGPDASGHALRLAGIKREQILTIDTLEWAPTVPDSTYFRAAGPSSSRIRATVADIRVIGLRNDNMRHRRLTASAILIASANLDLLADYRLPGALRRRVLWPTRFARLAWVVGIDSIGLDSGRIRYSEMRPGAASAGTVTFDRIHARIMNASNDSVATVSGPVVMEAEARLFGSGPLQARITVPVREGPLRLHAVGRLGSMPIKEFNGFVLPANGIEITGGDLHEATFSFDVSQNKATGEFRGQWEGFDLKLVDKRTGEQNLGKKLKTIVAKMIAKDDNMPDSKGKLNATPIKYVVLPTDTFWGVIWRSLKSGMMKAMKG